MNCPVTVLLVCALVGCARKPTARNAVDYDAPLTSVPAPKQIPAPARFEVVQSPVMARLTFRLDRYTGRIWQLVQGPDRSVSWEQMEVGGLEPDMKAESPRFEVSMSQVLASNTFLVDLIRGEVWVLVQSRGGGSWAPMFVDSATGPAANKGEKRGKW